MTLIKILKGTKGCRYVTLSASVYAANDPVNIYKKNSRRNDDCKQNSSNKSGQTTMSDKEIDDEEIVEETCDDEEVCCFVCIVIEALRIGENKILLAVAWTTNDGYVSHMRFLYVLGTDMTFGDNNEKRPHIRSIGKNARNKMFPRRRAVCV